MKPIDVPIKKELYKITSLRIINASQKIEIKLILTFFNLTFNIIDYY